VRKVAGGVLNGGPEGRKVSGAAGGDGEAASKGGRLGRRWKAGGGL
jgi:hypothetical protein